MSFSLPDNMPELNLSIPAERGSVGNVELNDSLLRHWIKRLPRNNILEFTQMYLDALLRFNRNQLDTKERLALLDLYREPLNKLLFSASLPDLLKSSTNNANQKLITDSLTASMAELAIGYKIVIIDAGKRHNNLKMNPVAKLAINRACEQLSFMALHAYKFYQTVPARVFKELHQLYQLVSFNNLAEAVPIVDQKLQADYSFKHRYIQILLVSISNPYGLKQGDVFEAYNLMDQLAPEAELQPLTGEQVSTAGHFFINCLSDRTPTPTVLPMMENQAHPPTLILNTKPVLVLVDTLFEQASNNPSLNNTANIELLKQLAPYLNTSYQRKQQREPVTGNLQAQLAFGLTDIHHCLTKTNSAADENNSIKTQWDILNKNSYGYLITRQYVENCHNLKIGDFVGIIEQHPTAKRTTVKLASIRWLRTDNDQNTKVGLKTIEGDPIAVQYSLLDDVSLHPALLLPEMSRLLFQPASLITAPGVFSPKQILQIKTRKKSLNFSLEIDSLIDQNSAFERFTFRDNI